LLPITKERKLTDTATATTPETTKQQTFTDQLQELHFKSLDQLIVERNDLVGRVNAANGDVQSLTEQIRDNSTDPDIAYAREQLSKWVLELDRLVKPKVEEALANRGEDTSKLEEDIKKMDIRLKPGIKYYKEMYGDDAAEFFTKQSRLQGMHLRSAGSGRRIRGFNITATVDGVDKTFENFSSAAKYIGVDTPDLQQAFFNKAQTEDADKLPDEVNFTVNFDETDSDGNKTEKEAFVRAFKVNADGNSTGEQVSIEAMDDEDDNGVSDGDLDIENSL